MIEKQEYFSILKEINQNAINRNSQNILRFPHLFAERISFLNKPVHQAIKRKISVVISEITKAVVRVIRTLGKFVNFQAWCQVRTIKSGTTKTLSLNLSRAPPKLLVILSFLAIIPSTKSDKPTTPAKSIISQSSSGLFMAITKSQIAAKNPKIVTMLAKF